MVADSCSDNIVVVAIFGTFGIFITQQRALTITYLHYVDTGHVIKFTADLYAIFTPTGRGDGSHTKFCEAI